MEQSIDAVITWVDGNDPALKAKQLQYFTEDEDNDITSEARFSDNGEIYYCISAIITNATFINRIFIVTDDQHPPVIAQIAQKFGQDVADRIVVVDHKEIFRGYEAFLPTFNSVSIETVLHRIPDLSERYIYFNDDFIIAKRMNENDFFVGNRAILRGEWRNDSITYFNAKQRQRMLDGRWHLSAKIFSYKECQYLAFKLLGFADNFFWHDHTPHPFYRPNLEAYFAENGDVLRTNLSFRIRDMSQHDTMSLANGLEILDGDATIRSPSLTLMKPSAKWFQRFYLFRKRRSFEKRESTFICVQSLSSTDPKARDDIFAWLNEIIFGKP